MPNAWQTTTMFERIYDFPYFYNNSSLASPSAHLLWDYTHRPQEEISTIFLFPEEKKLPFASGHCEFYVITLGCQRTTPMVNVSRLRWAPSLPLTTTHLCCVVQVQRSVYCNHFKPWLCCCFGLPNVEIFLLFYLLGCSKYLICWRL